MTNLIADEEFGPPAERLAVSDVLKRLKITKYRLAIICDVNKSTVSRWRKWIPRRHHKLVRAALSP